MKKLDGFDISLPQETYQALETLAVHEGKTTDGIIRDLIVSYLKVQAAKAGKTAGDVVHDLVLTYLKTRNGDKTAQAGRS